jgi:flavin-dependent dehydrogenase
MDSPKFDAIVIGARCAGSPTAMLLARAGCRVLLVDRDRFPSDTLSTHMIHPPGIAKLRRWGLLDPLAATGCPPIEKYTFDFGAFALSGRPQPSDGVDTAFGPRRTVLDKLLLDAAADSGAEVREGFVVDELLFDDGVVTGIRGHARAGTPVIERARVVVGADGRHSVVAKAVQPSQYREEAALECAYYTYWRNLPADGFQVYARNLRGWGVVPTHDDLTLVVVGWPYAEFEANKKDVGRAYLESFQQAPEFAERLKAATREAPYRGAAVAGYFRKPFGPGWALVGDAGYNKDPVTAWGISDAFRDADLCAAAIISWLNGGAGRAAGREPDEAFDRAMATYQEARDADTTAMYDLTCKFATLAPPSAQMGQLLEAASSSVAAQQQFVSMMAGTMSVPAFFAPEHVARIMAEQIQ